MPEASGSEVARAIRTAPALRACRIVMLTSAGAPERAGASDGVARCLTKPVRRAALLQSLAEVLSGDAPGAGEPRPAAVPVESRGRVLVAEDNPVNQLVIETMLRKRGFAVDVAVDGLQAVGQLDPATHRAVFMDCQMPNLDGYEATGRIRAGEPAGRHVPIVAMTAHAIEGDRERCLRAGMDDYLSKPLRAEELDAVLERWLAAPAAPSARATPAGGAEAAADRLVDEARVRAIGEVDPGLVDKLLDVFAQSTPPLLEELGAALRRGDDVQRRRLAHKLGGSSETVGAARLSELSRALEHGPDPGPDVMAELEAVYHATLDALRALVSSSTA
jgi:CheY-like chemotaxis protein/HPt (histidine-containing phosphotransfer) domain-containing protein